MKEELAGKITRNQQKVQHGKDMRTGELKKKQMEDEKVSISSSCQRHPT